VKTELKVKESSKSGRKLTANAEGSFSVLEEKYRLEFMVGTDSMNKINGAKELLSAKYPEGVKLENLRLLCAKHNRLMAEREYGREHMKKACRQDLG